MRLSLNIVSILLVIVGFISCDNNPTNGANDIPTTMPQEHIPWPSLADSPWPMYRHDPQGTGRSQYVGPQLGEIKWALPASGVASNIGFTSFAIGPDASIYFGSSYEQPDNGRQTWVFYAVAPDGTVKWTFRDTTMYTHDSIERAPMVITDSTVIFAVLRAPGGYVYALSPDRTLRWSFYLDGPPSDLNIGLNGTIFLLGGSSLYALTHDGNLKWKLPESSEFSGYNPFGTAISPDGQTLYIGGNSGYQTLYAVGIDGQIKWTFSSGDSIPGRLSSMPMVDNQGNIYIAPNRRVSGNLDTSASGIYSLSPDGEIRWKFGTEGPFNDQWTIDHNGHLFAVIEKTLYALDYAGNRLWEKNVGIVTAPLVCDANSMIYVAYEEVQLISGATGTELWNVPVFYGVFQSPALSGDGILYVGFAGGEGRKYVYAIH
ncbi:MAG: PQQ-binding-like beta-propeller repeat protein [Candidatus Marinimicrobia bacterium]|nr:PQQ-binding-like beta-propeller repeat protein [Candidatus Neomarinimicrobiota bacterium]